MEKERMNIEALTQAVAKEIEVRLPEAEVKVSENSKTNGIVLHGVTIMDGRQANGVYPTVYVENYNDKYLDGRMSVEDIAEDIIRQSDNHRDDVHLDVSMFRDFSKVKDKLLIKLVNTKKNEEYLKNVPHTEFLDLSAIYQILVTTSDGEIGTVTITNQLMEGFKVSVEELHQLAVENGAKNNPAVISSMLDVLIEMGMPEEALSEMGGNTDAGMIVVSNERKVNGAAVLLYEDTLKRVAEKYKMKKFYILPSSIHEVLAVKAENQMDAEELRAMVSEINSTQVAPDEVLSDNVYVYDAETNEFAVA